MLKTPRGKDRDSTKGRGWPISSLEGRPILSDGRTHLESAVWRTPAMHRPFSARLFVWFAALLPLLSAGCSTGGRGASGFSLIPQGHKLLDTTKDLRWANAGALQVPR